MSILYLVSTPIGNLEDITARALRILAQVSLIAAEDTRHTKQLLQHFKINTRLTSYYEHNKLGKLNQILEALAEGDIALVSDAGTPALNDPGYELVRAALTAGHQVSPIPGPSAPLAALVTSGLPTDSFLYLGYLPRKSGERQKAMQNILSLPYTLICLETPHRLLAALDDIKTVLGDRAIAVARELTKMHEEIFRGKISEAHAHFTAQPARGEITLVIAGAPNETSRWLTGQVNAEIEMLLANQVSASQIARQIAAKSGWPRRTIYQMVTEIQQSDQDGDQEPG